MTTVVGALVGRRAALRWVHLVLGGALLMPYWLLSTVLLGAIVPGVNTDPGHQVLSQLLALPLSLPMAAVTALVPVVRPLESAAARALCAGAAGARGDGLASESASTPARSWAARRRTSAWFVLHVLLGGIVSGMSLSVPPAVLFLLSSSFGAFGRAGQETVRRVFGEHAPPQLLIASALLLLLLTTNALCGALLARCAPLLLGPTPGERLVAAERRAAELAHRNRLARELHDSVGHALSAVTIQAAAAGRVLRSEPEFAAEALRAIEETARAAVAELDTVLGLLREETADERRADGGPTLSELDTLIRQMALAGVRVETLIGPGLGGLAPELSREAYRIVQEGLTNVLRHAGGVSARLRLELSDGKLELELENPLGADRPSRPGGGRGLRGIAERAATHRGGYRAGPQPDGSWRLLVWLPAPAPPAARSAEPPHRGAPDTETAEYGEAEYSRGGRP
ncbi:sensor histidine kinase [Kitasatospora sp. HPMI-4]|uniref:sensor histidine kinase n=1 Tax=Kitasatospora sp. HPMI-4 TaxID=3448443 RepID=UPI003F1C9E49